MPTSTIQDHPMKSIMEQASSIMKAIEKAWSSANNPKEFSVKIFEKEEKNFFGMTTKPAKIGIFFSDKPLSHQEKPTHKAATIEIKEQQRPEIKEQTHKPQQQKPAAHPNKQYQPVKPAACDNKNQQQKRVEIKPLRKETAKPTIQQHHQPTESTRQTTPATWSNELVDATTSWMKQTLSLMNMQSTDFSSNIDEKILKITFVKPLIDNPILEKQLFRSLAHLVMSSLRNRYKQAIKDLKVILIRPE